jgi:hypothetical protein
MLKLYHCEDRQNILLTFSLIDNGIPISSCSKITHATLPSHEQANKYKPLLLQEMSNTLSSKRSLITTKGLFSDVSHTLIDLSLEPMAQQQYCWLLGLPGAIFFKIFELNLYKNGNTLCIG